MSGGLFAGALRGGGGRRGQGQGGLEGAARGRRGQYDTEERLLVGFSLGGLVVRRGRGVRWGQRTKGQWGLGLC